MRPESRKGKSGDGKYRIKNKEASPKPEKGGALAKRSSSDMVKKAVKTAAQKKLSPAKTRPMLGSAQRPDLVKRKPRPQIGGSPSRTAVSGTPQRKALLGMMADIRGTTGLGLANIRAYLLSGDTKFKLLLEKFWNKNAKRFSDLEKNSYLLTNEQKIAFQKYSKLKSLKIFLLLSILLNFFNS